MQYILPILIVIAALLFAAFINKGYDYQCGKCNKVFSPSAWKAILTPHAMGKRLLKCPHCGSTSWATPVPKDNAR